MGCRQVRVGGLGLVLGVLWMAGEAPAAGSRAGLEPNPAAAAGVPIEQLPAAVRYNVLRVLERPTLSVHGPTEIFRGRPAVYRWLLDHPDQGSRVWRRLGAKCLEITDQGNGWFLWNDNQGTEISWETIYEDARIRVWYAVGSSRPAVLLPAVPLRAVVVLHHAETPAGTEDPIIQHQADLYLQTDGRTALLVARLLGSSANRLAEQGVAQLEMFFSALVWYFDRHPERAEALLRTAPAPPADGRNHGQANLP